MTEGPFTAPSRHNQNSHDVVITAALKELKQEGKDAVAYKTDGVIIANIRIKMLARYAGEIPACLLVVSERQGVTPSSSTRIAY